MVAIADFSLQPYFQASQRSFRLNAHLITTIMTAAASANTGAVEDTLPCLTAVYLPMRPISKWENLG